ncbi:ADP-ribosylglycohydrolase family protein [Cyanobacteria bacterium FACHB-471]|nr:ADP-ribosylglycohydrolase family protein [Cyanobacteria bacterium FACHB-471]
MSSCLSGFVGLCVGDALGVPVEFTSRAQRTIAPVAGMQGYGTWNQPPGTWSDDSSLTFCLAESLCSGYSPKDIAEKFCCWYSEAYWTAHGETFDVGNTTQVAIAKLQRGISPLESGESSDRSNGNGSLMRILPMAYWHKRLDFPELIDRVHQVASITHAHPRSQIACGIYISVAIDLLQGSDLETAYRQGWERVQQIYQKSPYSLELPHFERITNGAIASLPVDAIQSSGYVIHTLEAALWCLLNTHSYAEAVLKAVNLGDDTDTTAAVTGGLAGIYYGLDNIPVEWINQIARKAAIEDLATRFEQVTNA